jgi:hypothetical protein
MTPLARTVFEGALEAIRTGTAPDPIFARVVEAAIGEVWPEAKPEPRHPAGCLCETCLDVVPAILRKQAVPLDLTRESGEDEGPPPVDTGIPDPVQSSSPPPSPRAVNGMALPGFDEPDGRRQDPQRAGSPSGPSCPDEEPIHTAFLAKIIGQPAVPKGSTPDQFVRIVRLHSEGKTFAEIRRELEIAPNPNMGPLMAAAKRLSDKRSCLGRPEARQEFDRILSEKLSKLEP